MSASPKRDSDQGLFQWFVQSEVSGSVVLLAATVAALIWANSPWGDSYRRLVDTYVGVSFGNSAFRMSLGHWVSDGLMVVFFFVVGLEIKREVVVGQLSSPRQAVLPITAALGGAVLPALAYAALNGGGAGASGWGVPMATDIAFALGILAMFGTRVPLGLKVFLTALAIADDLVAVLVIAFFYTEKVSFAALGVSGGLMCLILAADRIGVRHVWIYLLLSVGTWAAVLASGVHATVAGVLLAMLIPVKGRVRLSDFIEITRARLADLTSAGPLTRTALVTDHERREALEEIFLSAHDARPPGVALEHLLHPVQAFLILPVFALVNAGVVLNGNALAGVLSPIGLGIVVGLFLGKQLGITLFAWLSVRAGYADLPEGVTWPQIWATSCVAGVGFTMAIFIAELAFNQPEFVETAKTAVLFVSLLAGVFGYVVLNRVLPRVSREETHPVR